MGQVTLACRRCANICRASDRTSKSMSPPGQAWSKHLGLKLRTGQGEGGWRPGAQMQASSGWTEAHLSLTPPHELHPADTSGHCHQNLLACE